ncbi:aminopeptidase N [Halopseudomonas nanhaiensis]|uniref:aminopeptidase N n=1 Tax=Halopseudomonas nanhaiensis TaxID=2830842 RepID=UPI001CBE54F1|nr:aminopeptidase N [Halopseudomonas nanhaiensis]UAW97086.1 aminopeptidase N [Halopseudomonas nanhaiensis]
MRTEQPKTIYLKDYQQPDYWIDETHLTFELFEDHALVHSRLAIRVNAHKSGAARPELVLDGQNLELMSVELDDERLASGDFQLDEDTFRLQPGRDSFDLSITTRIKPRENTALEGLYQSGSMFCTQCEAEGFRKITYYLDRPDVMSRFTTTVIADKGNYPVLLSNGNPIARGEHDGDRHWVTWEDPFPKPAYLFALVAGDLCLIQDSFTTMSGRTIDLRIYVEPDNREQCGHAMDSLKRSMRWDEEVYGREYDLDIFMIVAVNDFNMGAMENKGLNVFNSSCVLAHPDTATDAAFQRVEAVVAHEYFHNWSGNRVTCRDWFQLSLKEGFTVFRDAEFSADMNSATVKRIEDVGFLRANQFAEDAGPMAHPVRPDSFIEISNFYTLTVYEKGAEVVRMLHTLLGPEGFRKGTDLYFERHDGQAVTCDDFIKALEDANGADFSQFKRWYSQAGTPRLSAEGRWDAATGTFSLLFRQSCPPTPGQSEKLPFVIPVRMALLDAQGREMPLRLAGEAEERGMETVLSVTEAEQLFTFTDLAEEPLPSLLRGFSAPVRLSYPYHRDDRVFLAKHDPDGFNRWEAAQSLAVDVLQGLVEIHVAGRPLMMDQRLIDVYSTVLADETLDPAMVAEIIRLPSEAYLVELAEQANVDAIHSVRDWVRRELATTLEEQLWGIYRRLDEPVPYRAEAIQFARRSLKNTVLGYLMLTESHNAVAACVRQFVEANNMTDRQAALVALVNSPFEDQRRAALTEFAERWKDYPLVMDQWFSIQAGSPAADGLARVQELMEHPLFTLRNPNKVRSLIGAFANQNLVNFHRGDGAGYRFLADQILLLDGTNPQIASRLVTPLSRWRKFDPDRQALMKQELARILGKPDLSPDVYEVVSKSLA